MIVQIYEASSVKEAQELAKAGVDHVGIVVGRGPFGTEVIADKAKEILLSLPKGVKGVVLPLSYDMDEIAEIVRKTKAEIIHLCALPEKILPQDIFLLKERFPKFRIMRTIPVVGEESIDLAKRYEGVADYLLLDSLGQKGWQTGITGKTHNWKISGRIVESVKIPVILAGGLGPENVGEAIKMVKPYGVDSKTKTDRLNGKGKDIARVKEFVKKAKTTSWNSG